MFRIDRMRAIVLSIGFAAAVVGLAASSACRRDVTASAQGGADTQVVMRAVAVPVDGMICQVCAGNVKSALRRIQGVAHAEVSLEQRKVVIHYQDGKVSADQLTRAITELGYKAGVPTPLASQ